MIIMLINFLFFSTIASSQNNPAPSLTENFKQGVLALQQKNYKVSDENFEKILKIHPLHTPTLYNLGLSSFEQKKNGLALGLWRRAQYTEPQLKNIKKSINLALAQLPTPQKKESLWEKYRVFVLDFLSLNQFLLLSIGLISINGWFLIKHLNQKKSLTKSPVTIFLFILSALSLIITKDKVIDKYTPRGTIISESATLFVSPDFNSVDISQAAEGEEVIIKKYKSNWVQVKTLAGQIGWANNSHIIHSHGEPLW